MDLAVGLHAIRSFRFRETEHGFRALPIYWDDVHAWEGGICVARCQVRQHEAPDSDCHCGVYGSLSLGALQRAVFSFIGPFVAVIAAEGPTIMGDRGLRTAHARVVAHCGDVFRTSCERVDALFPGSRRYADLRAMLSEYSIPL